MTGAVLIAVIALPLLLYLPGLALNRAVPGTTPADLLERHYERVVTSALLSGWLALMLASFGIFSLWLQLSILVAACSIALLIQHWRAHSSKAQRRDTNDVSPNARPHPADGISALPTSRRLSHLSRHWEALAFALVGIIALLLVIRPFEVVLGARDAGVYAVTGFAIARTGSLVQHDALLESIGQAAESDQASLREPAEQALSNFLGVQDRSRYIATRLHTAGFFINEGDAVQGLIVPQFLHLFPAWIGLLTSVLGFYGGLFAPGLMGVLGAWSVGMLGRRLINGWVGVLAFLFLALNGVQVWFSRYSTAETTAQFLIFAGLYFFAKFQTGPENGASYASHSEPAHPAVDHPSLAPKRSDGFQTRYLYAILAGVAIGQVALTRIDFFLLGPVLLYLLYCWVTRRWSKIDTMFALGLGAMLLHAALHIGFIARAYFFDTGHDRFQDYALIARLALPFLTAAVRESFEAALASKSPLRIWIELTVITIGIGGLLLLRFWPARLGRSPIHRFEAAVVNRRQMLQNFAMIGVLVLGGYAYFVRPSIIDADMLFNTRGGWSDPLTRNPLAVQWDVNERRMSIDEAAAHAGVVLSAEPYWKATVDIAATADLRKQLRVERGPWQGPFSNQTLNWLRLQGYVGAPIHLPVRLWYNEYNEISWWERFIVDPAILTSEPAPEGDKYVIPLANLVRVGWYLSPLGIILGVMGVALWWRRDLNRASWLLLVVGLVGAFFWIRQTYGTSEQTYIYILRRFIPSTYPVLSLGMAYALVALVLRPASKRAPIRVGLTLALTSALIAFFVWTNRPIYRHVEYAGAVEQLQAIAQRFEPERDIALFRGGAPIYSFSRDVPDMVVTPLRFAFGIDAFTVKSSQPGAYADLLADQVRHWQQEGRTVYLVLSASGGSFVLPGFAFEPAGGFLLQLPEFEQLTNQKPRNVSQLTLPFAIYRLVPDQPNLLAAPTPPLSPYDFAAQVNGFYRPEVSPGIAETPVQSNEPYAWTNGDAVLRLPWRANALPSQIDLQLAGGQRPDHLGNAQACLSLQPETSPWPTMTGAPIKLGCLDLDNAMSTYTISLPTQQAPLSPTGSMLLRLESSVWIPAFEDQRQNDQRSIGVQFGGLTVTSALRP
ncbi:MAG: hypothetical protein MI924_25060 [Chloroflexales bacterium]|nr:hypothetical protein [Chloroflexales bacterium]